MALIRLKPQGPTAGREVLGLQYLRGIAAMMVVTAHLSEQIARRVGGEFNLAALTSGVDIFFVISGFVMAYSTDEGNKLSAETFLARRLLRIAPLYWICTGFMLLVMLTVPQFTQNAQLDWPHVIKSFAFVASPHPVFPDRYFPLLIPGWTINYEMFFYALFALSIWAGSRKLMPPMLAVTLILVALVTLGAILRPAGVLGFYTDPVMLEFLLGIFIAIATNRGAKLPAVVIVPLAIAAFALLAFPPKAGARLLIIGLPAAVIVFALATVEVPKLKSLLTIGDASYSLYLSHVFTASAYSQVMSRTPILSSFAGQVAFIVLGVTVCTIGGVLCWYIVERPVTERLRRQFLPRREAVAG